MTKPKTENERITEFSEGLYLALGHAKYEDYPTDESYMKGGLGVLYHSQHTVEEMEKIINRMVRRTLRKHKLRIIRKKRRKKVNEEQKQEIVKQKFSQDTLFDLFKKVVLIPKKWKGYFAKEFEMFVEGYLQRGREILGIENRFVKNYVVLEKKQLQELLKPPTHPAVQDFIKNWLLKAEKLTGEK